MRDVHVPRRAQYGFLVAFVVIATLVATSALQRPAGAATGSWTTDAQFGQGTFQGTVASGGDLKLSSNLQAFPIMWVANAGESTVSKIDTNTGRELARYRTYFAGDSNWPWAGAAPSRTTVDTDGNVYVANRHFDGRRPLIMKILATGGIDRSGNGVIDTSSDADGDGVISPGEMKPLVDSNGNGAIDPNEIQDERVVWVALVGEPGTLGRSLCTGTDGNLWLGTFYDSKYYKVSASNGSVLAGPYSIFPLQPYGCLVDRDGILWSASLDTMLGKLNTATGASSVYTHEGSDYGIALGNGMVYQANSASLVFSAFNPATNSFSYPARDKGFHYDINSVSVAGNGDIIATEIYGGVHRFRPDGSEVWAAAPPQLQDKYARGAILDSNGDVWVNFVFNNTIAKYRATDGAPLGIFPAGKNPYTYSDATGTIAVGQTTPTGYWRVVFDGGSASLPWSNLSWNATVPAGAAVEFAVRAADTQAGLDAKNYEVVSGPIPSTVSGRYVQIQIKLTASQAGQSPIVHDVAIQSGTTNQPPTAIAGGPYTVAEGATIALNGLGNDPDGDPLTYAWDLDNNGSFETPGQNVIFSAAGLDGPGSRTVGLRVCDDDNECATATAQVNIVNVAPTVSVANNGPINEGFSATITVTATDPAGSNDPLSYQFDCNNDGTFEIGPQAGNSASCAFADNGSFPVAVLVSDGDGGVTNGSTTVVVNNVAPSADAGPDASIYAGQTFNVNASFSDPGVNDRSWGYVISWGDSTSSSGSAASQGGVSGSHQYSVAGIYTVQVCVTDKDGGRGCDDLKLEVRAVRVQIDIKPGSFPNSINLRNGGNVPVGVFSATYNGISFDARTINPASVKFAGAPGLRIGKSAQDIDGDGDLDMVFHFETRALQLSASSTQACLTGKTTGNIYFEGCDSVRILTGP
ncbi:MAG: PKD domain-containing protein [Chloroflexi bacterium]|nr:PKD domain-containing protein [Chloroflexota bacterium]